MRFIVIALLLTLLVSHASALEAEIPTPSGGSEATSRCGERHGECALEDVFVSGPYL